MTTTDVIKEQEIAGRTPRLRMQLALSFFAFILIGANDGSIGVIIPNMRAHYGINNATISILFLFSTVGYLIAAFNSGLLVEKLGTRRFLLLGIGAFLAAVVILSFMPPFFLLLCMLLPLGFGAAVLDAGLNAYIAGLPRNTALLNYLHAFYGTGALLGPLIASSLLVFGFEWNSVYIVWIILSAILFIGAGLTFTGHREQSAPQSETGVQTENKQGKRGVLMTTLTMRVVWLAALFLLFYVGTETSLGSWSYSFLTEERHGIPLFMGWAVSGYWLGLTLGRLTLARAAQRMGEKRLIQLCLAGVAIGVLLVWLVPFSAVAAFGLCLTGFSLGPIFPTTIALMSRLVSARILPNAVGFLASFGSLGAAFFPWLAGNLAQFIGLWTLLPYAIILTVIMLGLWVMLEKHPNQPAIGN